MNLCKNLSVIAIAVASVALAAKNPMVGGQEMFPTRNIVQNAVNSADHTTLVAAVKAAGLVDTLQGPGPFTVFAPDERDGFEKGDQGRRRQSRIEHGQRRKAVGHDEGQHDRAEG